MKIGYIKFFVITCLVLVSNCSSNQEDKNQEIRFVDLQGNARAIKTRVPEANAKIMSGQSTHSYSEINNEQLTNKKNFVDAPNYYNKNSFGQKNISEPKFTENENFNKTATAINSKDNLASTTNQISQNSEASTNNPVIEYDLSKDEEKNKNADKKNYSQKELNDNLDSESVELSSDLSKKSRSNNLEEEYSSDENQFANSSAKNLSSKNKKALKKNAKIITYSNKKIKKDKQLVASNESEENSAEEQSYSGSSQRIYRSNGGRIYVQVGSFFNAKGAKDRLNLTKEFGKGKVQVAYNRNNKRIYRSVYGPFKSKNSAINFRDKVIESGNEAIIIRGK